MRNRNLIQHFFPIDLHHSRIDISWQLLILFSAVSIVGWTMFVPGDILARSTSALLFLGSVQFILAMLMSSRISMLFMSVTALFIFGSYSPAELSALSIFLIMVALAQVYLVLKGKLTSIVVAIAVGLLAAGEGRFAALAIVMFSLLLTGRMLWHLMFEKMGKKIWFLFSIKVVGMIVLATGLVIALKSSYTFPWVSNQPLHWPEVHWLVSLMLGLLALRGLWSVLLLRTRRSPADRGFRLFCFLFGLAVVALVAVLRGYGAQIFLPAVMESFRSVGLLGYSPEVLVVAIASAFLLVSAGIDRSLYRDTRGTIPTRVV